MENQEKKSVRKNVRRSPNFPLITLEDAIKYASAFYSENKRAAVSKMSTLKSLGFKGEHGQSLGILSAMKKYNLIKEENDNFSLTSESLTILLVNDENRKAEIIRDCALKPGIYSLLWERFSKTGLPSDNSLSDTLIFDYQFNENTVASFLKGFRATMEFAKLKFGEGFTEEGNPNGVNGDLGINSQDEDKTGSGSTGLPLSAGDIKNIKPNIRDYAIPRKGDKIAIFRLETPVSNDDIDIILKWLDLLRGTIVEGDKN